MALDNKPFQTPQTLIGRMNMVVSDNGIVDILLNNDEQPIAKVVIAGMLQGCDIGKACVITNALEKALRTGKSSTLELGLTSHYVLSEDKKTLDLRFIDPQSSKNSETSITLSRIDDGVFSDNQIQTIMRSFVIAEKPSTRLQQRPTAHP